MLATPWPDPFDDPDWLYEVKWDGYRCLVATGSDRNRLHSRRGVDLATRFPTVARLPLPPGWVIDGEIVAFDEEGRPDFSRLQAGEPVTLVAFDVLVTPEGDVMDEPLEARRERLAAIADPAVIVPDPIRGEGSGLFQAVLDQGLEGIVAKRATSPYLPGRRSPDWRKVAGRRRMRAVVGGWLPGEGGRRATFGSLLVGLWRGEDLEWIGAVGSGFADAHLRPLREALDSLERDESPFSDTRSIPREARWVQPGVVVEVEFKEWTRDHRLRAPVFKGVSDVPAAEVTWEEEGPGLDPPPPDS